MGQRAIGLVAMLVSYLAAITIAGPPAARFVWIALVHVGLIGFLVAGIAEIFFTPPSFMKNQDKNILKKQYMLAKAMPFRRGEFLQGYWLALFIPEIIIGGVILALVNILTGGVVSPLLFFPCWHWLYCSAH